MIDVVRKEYTQGSHGDPRVAMNVETVDRHKGGEKHQGRNLNSDQEGKWAGHKRDPEEFFQRMVIAIDGIEAGDGMMDPVKFPEKRHAVLKSVKPVIQPIEEAQRKDNEQAVTNRKEQG